MMSTPVRLELDLRPSRFTRRAGDEPLNGYRLLSPLGVGGFGEVWKCLAPGGLLKAMKIVTVPPQLELDETQAALAKYEQAAMKRVRKIRHPFLVSVDRLDYISGELFIVMELADSSLLNEFQQYRDAGHPGIPEDHLLHYLLEAAEVLDLMNFEHGLQHLDVKPANLLLCNRHLKLADFGLVNYLAEPPAEGCRPVSVGCTPRYASPELLQGSVSRFCDQYSLAFVYQELLTGELPFDGDSLLRRLVTAPKLEALPESDRPVVARALSVNPRDRYSSCLEFTHALLKSKFDSRTTKYLRVPEFNSLTKCEPFPNDSQNRSAYSKASTGEDNSVKTTSFRHRPLELQSPYPSGDSSDTPSAHYSPVDTVGGHMNRHEEPTASEMLERVEYRADTDEVTYPPTIHVSDLRWKPDPKGERALSLDDFIARLVAAETEHVWFPQAGHESPNREVSAIIKRSFIIPTISEPSLGEKFKTILRECHAVEVSRSEKSIVLAVEGRVPFWEMLSSRQRVLKISVNVEEPGRQEPEFCWASVRITPLSPEGPSLHPRLFDVRSLLLRKIREILQAAPERRRSDRWTCNFGVRLYPILRDWRFGPAIEARAIDLSGHGIGLISPGQPPTKRFYVSPSTPSLLSDFAILTEVVQHTILEDGSYAWGAAFGQG